MAEASDELLSLLATLEEVETLSTAQKFIGGVATFVPYAKQMKFFATGLTKKERLLMAGNQLGKTQAGAFETTCHLTGKYPTWWPGRRYTRPIRMWAAGESSLLVRDVQQAKLCGPPGVEGGLGTGMIAKEDFADQPTLSRGVTDAYDTIQVKHISGGISTCTFKSYEQGRKKFQGEPVDIIWCDEEPPMDIYSECLTRTTATKGIIYVTFTPLLGKSDVVIRFMDEPSDQREVISMTIYDVGHYTKEEAEAIIAGWPAHEREARAKGIPMMGSGRIFPYSEEMIIETAMDYIPAHWTKLWSIDFGIGHPFAATLMLWDKDNDVLHVHATVRMADALPIMHAAAIKPIGASVPVAWPQDGTAREKSGETVSQLYRKEGLLMLADHATWPDGGISTEAGILELQQRMQTGRFKVASHLVDWFDEYRQYHRKDGLIVKVRDDLMSATRVGVMAKRFGRLVNLGAGVGGRNNGESRVVMAAGLDFDIFTGQ